MGTDFGKHGYAPGIGEEIEPKPTMGERLVRWFVDSDIAAEERQALLQHARRIKLRTDLQEARVRQRIMDTDEEWQRYKTRQEELKEKDDKFWDVALWVVPIEYRGEKVSAKFLLQESVNKGRKVDFHAVTEKGSDRRRDDIGEDQIKLFITSSRDFLRHIRPWLLQKKTLEEAQKDLGGEDWLVIY